MKSRRDGSYSRQVNLFTPSQRGKPQPKSEPRIARMTRMGRPHYCNVAILCGPFASFAPFAAKKFSQKSKEPAISSTDYGIASTNLLYRLSGSTTQRKLAPFVTFIGSASASAGRSGEICYNN